MNAWEVALDRWITSGDYRKTTVELYCPPCETTREVDAYVEYGCTWLSSDDDYLCPDCGHDCSEDQG